MINLNAEVRLPAGIERLLAQLAFSSKVRERCWRKLASQQRHRMPLDESLRLFIKQSAASKSPAKRCYEDIQERLAEGKNLGEALSGYASPEEVLLIHSSQKGGNLPEGLTLAADLLAAKRKIIASVLGAVTYPVMLTGVIIVFLYVIATVVMPQLSAITDPKKWYGAAAFLYQLSSFINSSAGLVALVAFLTFLVVVIATLPHWRGKGRYWADKIPPWSIYRLLVGISWLHTVATLISAGQKLVDILDAMLSDSNTTPYLKSILRKLYVHAARGANLGDALEATKLHWPAPKLVEELQAYANLPGFGQQLRSIATDWLSEGIEMITWAARGLNVICITTIGVLIVLITMSVGSIQENIMHGMGM